jgi:hypothetical protein
MSSLLRSLYGNHGVRFPKRIRLLVDFVVRLSSRVIGLSAALLNKKRQLLFLGSRLLSMFV